MSESSHLGRAPRGSPTRPAGVLESSDASSISALLSLSTADLRKMEARDISEAPPHVQAVVHAYQAFNERDLDRAVPELDEARTCITREEIRRRLEKLLRAFPDLTVWNLRAFDLGEGRVAVRFRFTGTHDGPLDADTPPTGRHFEAEMLDLVQVGTTGLIIDGRNLSDLEPIRRQLGVS